MLEWKSYRTVTDDSVLREVEQRTGRRLPPEYAALALKYSGGVPQNRIFTVCEQPVVFNRLISAAPDKHPNLLDALTWVEDAPGRSLIPFATDVFGNLLCFNCLTATYYSIVWLEMETGVTIPLDVSFTHFMDSLRDKRGGDRP